MSPVSPPTVDRWNLPEWLSDVVTDGQLRLSPGRRWSKVLTHEDMPLTSTQTLVALALGMFMGKDGIAYPSLTSLAKATKLSRRAVAKALRDLVEAEWLMVIEEGGPGLRGGAPRTTRYKGRYPTDDPRIPHPGAAGSLGHDGNQSGDPEAPPSARGSRPSARGSRPSAPGSPEVKRSGLEESKEDSAAAGQPLALTGQNPNPNSNGQLQPLGEWLDSVARFAQGLQSNGSEEQAREWLVETVDRRVAAVLVDEADGRDLHDDWRPIRERSIRDNLAGYLQQHGLDPGCAKP